MTSNCDIYRISTYDTKVREIILQHLPDGNYRTIMVKPNWVCHERSSDAPIGALVTSSDLIDCVIEACLKKYPALEELTVGDVPLQGADWELLKRQAGIHRLIDKYSTMEWPRISFSDLRRERALTSDGYIMGQSPNEKCDPKGYRDVILDGASFLDPISHTSGHFRCSDYNPEETRSSHRKGYHRYSVAGSTIDCDLFINVPKMKCHQKAGITGALKNLVGINCNKAYLVHYLEGTPASGGDEFPPDVPLPVVLQTRVRQLLMGRSKFLFQAARRVWRLMRKAYGIEVEVTPGQTAKNFFIAAGSWYGNDTIWRMIYDLNKVLRYVPRQGGAPAGTPQRDYLTILDGLVAGEGDGPLNPRPVNAGVFMVANDPFLADMAMSRLMGFDYRKIPSLRNAASFGDPDWGAFDPHKVSIRVDNSLVSGVESIPVIHQFLPPPGWQGHIEGV